MRTVLPLATSISSQTSSDNATSLPYIQTVLVGVRISQRNNQLCIRCSFSPKRKYST